MKRLLDKLLTRRRHLPNSSAQAPHLRQRLALACRELDDAERAIAAALDLTHPPRLLMIDEEKAVILTPADRIDPTRHDH